MIEIRPNVFESKLIYIINNFMYLSNSQLEDMIREATPLQRPHKYNMLPRNKLNKKCSIHIRKKVLNPERYQRRTNRITYYVLG